MACVHALLSCLPRAATSAPVPCIIPSAQPGSAQSRINHAAAALKDEPIACSTAGGSQGKSGGVPRAGQTPRLGRDLFI